MKPEEKREPSKVTWERLRNHFKTVYRLADEQVEMMLKSSSRSLSASFDQMYEALKNESDFEKISRTGHSLKGLLLNMGESAWAEIARDIELSAAARKPKDYRALVDCLHSGVEEVLSLKSEQ